MCVTCPCSDGPNDHGDSRNLTLLDLRCAAEAAGISVADAAANLSKSVASLAKSRSDTTGLVIKADDSKHFLLTVAYPAWKPDVAVAADGHIDVAPADVVEKACWSFMRKGARVGMWHEPGNEDAAEVVESYIHRADPWVIKAADGTEQVIMPGDWLVGLKLAPKPWAMYKAGLIGGVSPQGGARRQRPSKQTLEQIRSRANG